MLMAVCSFSKAATKEAYAVYNNGTLTFYYDTSKSSQTGDIYALNDVGEDPDWYTYHCNDIKKVVFTKNPNHENVVWILIFGRDYWTRTSDLAPPRRVRYQL